MIDIHSHILFGVDDGSASLEQTMSMLRIAVDEGIESIIATPHYIIGANKYTKADLLSRYEEVCNIIEKENIPIKLMLGNELFADAMLPDMLVNGECCTLGNSKYVLVEFSPRTAKYSINNLIYNISLKGYTPIIAHPERTFAPDDVDTILKELVKKGCYLQMNSGSVTGIYGEKVNKIAIELLDRHMVHFVATDSHTHRRRSPRVKKAYEFVENRCGARYAEQIFNDNGLKVINDSLIEYVEPKDKINNGLIHKLKYIFNMN
ncbi:exopolysaccharide biosynthesis protein [Vallitalea longa]|uniref:protein-tyrosine-phosphatase n=1 Tax=Vallitalea longa TaxID=2936439 RepID=A0A9W6DHP2_9FIRM|nr:CpsB/CapC family capsule biosynthesis tyrosine phosphatase [Vallitalea longa]GKX31772.1 exopolysaccharide biosynthesis protein [Vallitalea longa]